MASKKTKPKSIMPDRVYVVMEKDGDESYPVAYDDASNIGDGAIVGIFDLNKTVKMKVTTRREFVEL